MTYYPLYNVKQILSVALNTRCSLNFLTLLDSCPAGNFYNKTSGSCAPCGNGYYQPDTGRTYCLACAIGKTTTSQTAMDKTECFGELNRKWHCNFQFLVPCL